MMKPLSFFLVASCSVMASNLASAADVVVLTEDNYGSLTDGKTVFLKMFAPWCGHCKSMAPAWEQVASEWKDHPIGLVGEVDCTEPSSESICEMFQVEAFPSIMYGDPTAPEEYQGGRDYESLSEFAKANIGKAVCSMSKLDACPEEDKKIITELKKKSKEDLLKSAADVDEKVQEGQDELDAFIEKINEQYEEVTVEFNKKTEKLKAEANYKWIKQVLLLDHGVTLGGGMGGEDDQDVGEDDDVDPIDDDEVADEL